MTPNTQNRHVYRMRCMARVENIRHNFGPQAAYTFLMRRGFSIEAASYVVFGLEHEVIYA